MRNIYYQIAIAILIGLVLTGCGFNYRPLANKPESDTPDSKPITIVPAVKAPLRFRSLVESYIREAGITDSASINDIFAVYNSQKSNLPQTGQAAELNSASLGAVFLIAGQVCGALRDKESRLGNSSRIVFKDFNFAPASINVTPVSLASDSAVKLAGDSLVKMFAGRPATEEEKASFVQAKDQMFLGQTITANNNRKLIGDVAIGLCTAVASSLEAISL